ncbi:MAG: FkbM family methyltransferase [Planctomycetota bacterium]|jgi:FkbM family methyltransferase
MMGMVKRHNTDFEYIVGRDSYRVRDWPAGSFETVVDIGANIGIFSAYIRMLQPSARIIAIEPSNDVYSHLCSNTRLFRVETEQIALGDGSPLYWRRRKNILDSVFVKEEDENSYRVESITLSNLFAKYDVDYEKSYMIKLDCEGGEKYLFGDEFSENILRTAEQVSMEVHFRSDESRPSFWPTWYEIDEWVKGLFTHHSIEYYISSKTGGYGHYCIRSR